MTRFTPGEKGISPLIAAVLLIAFTMTIAAILATWAQTFGRGRLKEAGEKGKQAIECSALSIRVESAAFSNNTIQAVTWNTGNTNLTEIDMLAYNQSVSTIPQELTMEKNYTIKPGDYKVLKGSGLVGTPDKFSILVQRSDCPKVQPLYTCTYSDGEFVC